MGYTHFRKLSIREFKDEKRNPVATITIPYDLIKKFKWKDRDLIIFSPYSSKSSEDISLINAHNCPKTQFEGPVLRIIFDRMREKISRTKTFNQFPPKRRKQILKFKDKFKKQKASS